MAKAEVKSSVTVNLELSGKEAGVLRAVLGMTITGDGPRHVLGQVWHALRGIDEVEVNEAESQAHSLMDPRDGVMRGVCFRAYPESGE